MTGCELEIPFGHRTNLALMKRPLLNSFHMRHRFVQSLGWRSSSAQLHGRAQTLQVQADQTSVASSVLQKLLFLVGQMKLHAACRYRISFSQKHEIVQHLCVQELHR